MSIGELGSGWKNVEQYEDNIRFLERKILEEIGNPEPNHQEIIQQIRTRIQVNEELCAHAFGMNVAYDVDILSDLVERNLLDSDGR